MQTSNSRLRKALIAAGGLVVMGALAQYIYRDITVGISLHKEVRMIVPCSAGDKERAVFDAGYAKFCMERLTRDIIKRRIRNKHTWEPHVVKELEGRLKPGDVAIDVGAHVGGHTLRMSQRVGPQGQVIAFEPQFKLYQELLVNLDLNQRGNVRAEMVALGDRPARVSMNWARDTNEGSTGIGSGGNRVELRTLDSYRLEKVSLIKIDVEGFEANVLRGARQTLLKHRPVLLIEIQGGEGSAEALKQGNPAVVFGLLKACGYEPKRLLGYDYIALPLNPSPK